MSFEEWWSKEHPYHGQQYARGYAERGWQAAQAEQAAEVERLKMEVESNERELDRLRLIIISDGLEPDLPIPPGLNLQLKRAERERDELRQQCVAKDEALREVTDRWLADMHAEGPECAFNGATGGDIGCQSCLAQAAIEAALSA
jgi:hypothetical protein